MEHQPRKRAPRDYGRRREMLRHEKAKAKATQKKHRSSHSYMLEEEHVSTSEEVVDRTLSSLRILGSQRFALPPFHEHFNRWLSNLGTVLYDFESSPAINVDNQFVKERSQILSDVGLQLDEVRHKEVSREEAVEKLLDDRLLLERIEREYTTRTREIEGQKDREIRHLSRDVNDIREELDRIARMKAGIFRTVSKKTKAQKKAEATQKLNLAQKNLRLAKQNFAIEQERLRDEYERKKQLVIEQIRDLQKGIENQELDFSLKGRQDACKSLADAVNVLLQRKKTKTLKRRKKTIYE